MDHNRFDRLSQTLANTSLRSRRSILAALGVVVLGTIAGVDPEVASARHKSRRHTRHKSRHAANPGRRHARGLLRAAGRTLDSSCEASAAGGPYHEPVCIDETTLQPACTCDGEGQWNCPAAAACPSQLACQKGSCLTQCIDDTDCAKGNICFPDGRCTVPPSCDCANLNFCGGHGSCTQECTCVCDEGWFGAECDAQPTLQCSDRVTCQECGDDVFNGCVFCSTTVAGASGVCVTSDQCLVPQDGCKK
jgi:hypothetical protein